jgi:photosystem II stability/assembly factor-like uncharacterized protein
MKRFALLWSVPVLALTLSGCGGSDSSSTVEEADEPNIIERMVPQGFSQQTEKGSIWKSEDGGRSFSVRSTVDEKNRIEKADILDFEFHPTKPKTIIASTAEHGIFKTEDGGESWIPIEFPPKRIYSFILDRRDPDRRMFASGVIENRGRIFRSDDEGANWTPIYVEPGTGTTIASLAQDPRNPDILYAGTSKGTLVKSADAGATWKNIGETLEGVISRIFFDVTDPNAVFLLLFNDEMKFSRDGGESWVDWDEEKRDEVSAIQDEASRLLRDGRVSEANAKREAADALRKQNQENDAPRNILALLPDPSRSGVLYAGSKSGLYRSSDFGKFWEKLDIIESAEEFAIRSIAVNPKNFSEIVFVSGKAFYRSEDGGLTWSVIPLSTDRPPAQIEYDPFDSRFLFLGLREF